MKIDWNDHIGKTVNIVMKENYGVVYNDIDKENPAFFEIVFKSGVLEQVYDEGLFLSAVRKEQIIKTYVPYESIKCVDIFEEAVQ